MVEEQHFIEKVHGVLVIFGFVNTSSSQTDNQKKKNFFVLGEGQAYEISGSFGTAEKKSVFSKAKTKFWLSLHDNGVISYLHVDKTEI